MQDYEKLGVFYLGQRTDAPAGTPLLYDARDLTTHAVCLGMTGSGKTGLCLALLEEAALDGIPAIAIDPKGDLGNLLLTFPELRPADFLPWIDPEEAERRGQTREQRAADVAASWRAGLLESGQDGARIARFRAAVDLALYTPGSSAGLPLTVLNALNPPDATVLADDELLRERVTATTSGLAALLDFSPDPLASREAILVAQLLEQAWRQGRTLDLAALIREIQTPPLTRVGVLDLESFYPAKERFALAQRFNNLLASPAFAGWLSGPPLDVARLLRTTEGRPRLSILSIAHLSDAERMFFVTLLLNEIVAWMRGQEGTSSLRAILYMDEIFGYFPPVAAPPSKRPMLTLLKQARAYGLGVVLATQNPVDLDYKGLANTGTWFLGRLQTERDKARLIEGLDGISAASGQRLERAQLDALMSGLEPRTFLLHNVHDDAPVVFRSRWALSYLRGPLTRAQIQTLTASPKAPAPAPAPPVARAATAEPTATGLPVIAPGIETCFLAPRAPGSGALVYRPALLGVARLHYVQTRDAIDHWEDVALLADVPAAGEAPWDEARILSNGRERCGSAAPVDARFGELPGPAAQSKLYERWARDLAGHLYQRRTLELWSAPALKATSRPGESEGDFRTRVDLAARERRDAEVEKLRARYAPKIAALRERARRASDRTERERAEYDQQKLQTTISLGATVLGALFGRKAASIGTLGRATTAARGVSRAAREREDIGRSAETEATLSAALAELERQCEADAAALTAAGTLEVTRLALRPRKSDIGSVAVMLAWTPWEATPSGLVPAFD